MPDNSNINLNSNIGKEKNFEYPPEKIEIAEKGIEGAPLPESKTEKVINREALRPGAEEARQNLEKTGEAAAVKIGGSDAGQAHRIRQKQIEKVLEADLKDIYLSLSPLKRNEFKIVGEQTAEKINNLLEKGKVKIGKIIDLIKNWLHLVPGINRFFMEQEAKIKADEIMKLKA